MKFGIDLGTTNSSIAYAIDPKNIKIMQFNLGIEAPPYSASMVSSKVFIHKDQGSEAMIRVGYVAQAAFRQFATFSDAKLIERLKMIVETEPEWTVQVGSTTYGADDVLAFILQVLKRQADNDAKAAMLAADGVVMGVPVDFKDSSKEIYFKALVKAGFYKTPYEAKKRTEFVSEPLAVAVKNGIDLHADKNVLVFDFGGGTLDVTVVNLREQVNRRDHLHPHEVKAKRRIDCGGELLTRLFFENSFCSNSKYSCDEIADAFDLPKGLPPSILWQRMMETSDGQQFCEEIEKLKCELSIHEHSVFTFMGDDGVIVDDKDFSRSDFEQAIEVELAKVKKLVRDCLNDAKIDVNRIGEVVLAGGSALIPCVQNLLIDMFGRVKVKTKSSDNLADENEVLTSVVRGLAIVGGADTELLDDIVDKDYGVLYKTHGRLEFEPIIRRNTRIADTAVDLIRQKGPHTVPFLLDRVYPERLHVDIAERVQGTVTPISSFEFEIAPYSRSFSVYMSVKVQTGMLQVTVYDEDSKQSVKTQETEIKQHKVKEG